MSLELDPVLQAQYQTVREMLPEFFLSGETGDSGEQPAPDSAPAEPVDANQMLHDVSAFIARYLHCSGHQRTVLAFWILHTYTYFAADVTAYLSVQSAQPQAGKTTCLQVLGLLTTSPALTSGLTAGNLLFRIGHAPPSAILLDECQATLGTCSRPKAPGLRALLATNYYVAHGYMGPVKSREAFMPKAFAGRGPLPEELAELSLPIILQPITSRKQAKKLKVRLTLREAEPLRLRLWEWAQPQVPEMAELPRYEEEDLPEGLRNLSLQRQDVVEPLLRLAERIGGEWPERLRQALIAIFEEEAAFKLRDSLGVLNAIYACFCCYGFPEQMKTATVLEWLYTQEKRPWENDGPMTAQKLAKLLAMLEIRPRLQRMEQRAAQRMEQRTEQRADKGSENPARGYLLEDFRPAWKKHFNYESLPAEVLHPQSEIVNNDAACNGLAQDAQVAVSGPASHAQPTAEAGAIPDYNLEEVRLAGLRRPW
jgi:hypothetical protein